MTGVVENLMAYSTACERVSNVDQPAEVDQSVPLGKTGVHRKRCTDGSGVAFADSPLRSRELVKVRISRWFGLLQHIFLLVLPVAPWAFMTV